MCGSKSVLYNNSLILSGNMYLRLFKLPLILEHLLEMFSELFFLFKCVSKVNPKKLNSSTFSMLVLLILGTNVCQSATFERPLFAFYCPLFFTEKRINNVEFRHRLHVYAALLMDLRNR